MKLCVVPGCQRRYAAKGYCGTHYKRVVKYGTPDLPVRPEPQKRFVDPTRRPHLSARLCLRWAEGNGCPHFTQRHIDAIEASDHWKRWHPEAALVSS